MSAAGQIDALEAEVENGVGQLVAAGERRLSELLNARERLDQEIAAVSRKLRVWQSVRKSVNGETAAHLHVGEGQTRTKREAVLALLGEYPSEAFRLVTIRRALIERGWMADDENSIHALEVAVRAMEQRGEVYRMRKGIYTLSPPSKAEDVQTDESIGVQI